ncbi:MAG: hypothetical protein WCE62_20825 [Polyangiales bacterium]
MPSPHDNLITLEVLQKIRAENQTLLLATQNILASIETGRFDEAVPIAAELGKVLRKHVLLVDGVLDVLSPDDVSPARRRRG